MLLHDVAIVGMSQSLINIASLSLNMLPSLAMIALHVQIAEHRALN